MSLTPAGRAWATELTPIFTQLHAAHRKLNGPARRGHREVAVSIIPSFGNRWLVPRLGRFLDAHPDIELRISASAPLVDFAVEPIDLGIRYGAGRYPGLTVEQLAADALVVVATPALLARRRLREPRDLRHERLIHDDAPDAWSRWFVENGVPGRGTEPRAELEDSSMLVEAALRGQGVALARWSLVVDELRAGRLQLPFPKIAPLPTGLAYYLAAPRENLRRPAVAAFWSWVVRESAMLRKYEV